MMVANNSPQRISPEMTVLDIISAHRQTEAVFRSYDRAAGECVCCNALFEPLKDMAARYNLDLEELLAEIKASVSPENEQKPL